MHRSRLQFKVLWEGYDQPSWEPFRYVLGATAALEAYFSRYPERLGYDSWAAFRENPNNFEESSDSRPDTDDDDSVYEPET